MVKFSKMLFSAGFACVCGPVMGLQLKPGSEPSEASSDGTQRGPEPEGSRAVVKSGSENPQVAAEARKEVAGFSFAEAVFRFCACLLFFGFCSEPVVGIFNDLYGHDLPVVTSAYWKSMAVVQSAWTGDSNAVTGAEWRDFIVPAIVTIIAAVNTLAAFYRSQAS